MKKQSLSTLLSLTAAAVFTVFAGQAYAMGQNNQSNDFDARIKKNASDIMQLKQADRVQNEKISDNTTAINQLNGGITRNAEAIKRISLGKGVDPKKVEQIDKNTADIAANKKAADTRLGSVETRTTQNEKGIADLQKQYNERNLILEILSINSGSFAKDIKANKEEAAQLKEADRVQNEKINDNTVAIRQLDGGVRRNANAIDRVEAKTAQNAAKIQQLDKEIRRGLASQAALGGLFQPYNVGKLNVSAAVGGYGSETAVAVGTGFRFNEHFATKAGAAFNTKKGGSGSYNVGVNFEW
ncbi:MULTISPECIES: YadA-like family protein [unclassified Neisseria]|uniref:YadA-like family protein n=1 Tax=unclassified Neisseria TaxID=2623750 RepID=UPI002665D92F|nr:MULTISPECIES: YadA-like family protein [unclassified Neisseria]MDO1509465.1 YadA-like family protein [Neisseria sp. MVDL19-042950]MDO1515762.1 YadA-like family protein [Neisseria sp. MVDL18-041461]MDO1563414.1 YadA-like family protein [Neisseria sp. MVDL20-010259]